MLFLNTKINFLLSCGTAPYEHYTNLKDEKRIPRVNSESFLIFFFLINKR